MSYKLFIASHKQLLATLQKWREVGAIDSAARLNLKYYLKNCVKAGRAIHSNELYENPFDLFEDHHKYELANIEICTLYNEVASSLMNVPIKDLSKINTLLELY